MESITFAAPVADDGAPVWRRVIALRIGPLPLLVYIAACTVVIAAAFTKKLPNDLIGGLGVMMLLGFLLGEVGSRIPVLKHIGGAAILCLFVPSAMKAYEVFDPQMQQALTTTMKTANMQYLYIAGLVVGSILGMNRRTLVQGFMRMFIPLLVGTVAATVVGIGVGLPFGYEPRQTFFDIIVPILGGGIGEGILPLSIAYAEITGKAQADIVGTLIPAALIGNVAAILLSGALSWLGERRPALSGNGTLMRGGDDILAGGKAAEPATDLRLMGAGLLLTCLYFTLGAVLSPFTGIPGPVLMIIAVALTKVLKLMPPAMEQGGYQFYLFLTRNLTFAILVGLGTLFVPWKQMMATMTVDYLLICISAVAAMVASGFFVGRLLNMNPVESGIVTACHSGLGGTGDVAILSASNRMGLMPFAQISTRIGGAAMVVLATLLLKITA
ncbi:MAG: 2-hydroxycarboxylate transporter family protein [Paucibacter sp.]|nr:2-hydroxycarboxylate transporter family protein [Roseateles sp.]